MYWLRHVFIWQLLLAIGRHWPCKSRHVLLRHWIVLIVLLVINSNWPVVTYLRWHLLLWSRELTSRIGCRISLRFSVWRDSRILIAKRIDGLVWLINVIVLQGRPLRFILFIALNSLCWRSLLLGRANSEYSSPALAHATWRL